VQSVSITTNGVSSNPTRTSTSDWSIVGFGGDDTSDWSIVGFGGDDTSDWSTVGFGSIFEGIGFSLGANRSSSLSSPNKESKKYIA
jgi:hypothetical protein